MPRKFRIPTAVILIRHRTPARREPAPGVAPPSAAHRPPAGIGAKRDTSDVSAQAWLFRKTKERVASRLPT